MRLAIVLSLALSGCATMRNPEIHEYPNLKIRTVVGDPTSINRAYRSTPGEHLNDLGGYVMRGQSVNGFAMRAADGYCEIWLSWYATMMTLMHELGHCDGSRTREQVYADFK
jgi:hypothetical protein